MKRLSRLRRSRSTALRSGRGHARPQGTNPPASTARSPTPSAHSTPGGAPAAPSAWKHGAARPTAALLSSTRCDGSPSASSQAAISTSTGGSGTPVQSGTWTKANPRPARPPALVAHCSTGWAGGPSISGPEPWIAGLRARCLRGLTGVRSSRRIGEW